MICQRPLRCSQVSVQTKRPRSPERFSHVSLPCAIAVVTVEPHFHVVKPIGHEILWRVARVIDHLSLGVQAAFGIDSDEIVSKDPFNRRGVARRDGFRPLPFAVEDVALRFFLIFLLAAIAKAEYSDNRQNAF